MNIAVLASGNGSNFEALVKYLKSAKIDAKINLLVVDKKNAFVRTRAKKLKIKELLIDQRKFPTRIAFEKEIAGHLQKEQIDLVVLAGYMRIISSYFIKQFKNKIINIHPALLPAFRGRDAIKRAFNHGSKVSGVTIHFVDEQIDHGPIILQESIEIPKNITLKKFEAKIHALEHKLLPQAIKLFSEKKVRLFEKKVKIT